MNRMKNRIVLLVFFVVFISTLFAQTSEITSHILNWKGVEKWNAGKSSIHVISFDSAQYPAQNYLPYYSLKMECDPAFSYKAELKNPNYIPLTFEENSILSGNNSIPDSIEVSTTVLNDRGTGTLKVSLLPFVIQGGILQKLKSFDLQVVKSSLPQKTVSQKTRAYASTSVLAQGKFVKIRITNNGVYKLTYEDLVLMGIHPADVRIFGFGGGVLEQSFTLPKIDDLPEVGIYMNKGTDGVFNSGDYVLFYAQGISKWTYDKTKSMFTHKINPYSSYGYYFVTSDAGTGRRIEEKPVVLPESPTIHPVEEFVDYQVYEKDIINLCKSGKEFYGETFSSVTTYNLPFNFPNPVLTNSVIARLDVAATSSSQSTFSLDLNGMQTKNLSVSQILDKDYDMGMGASAVFTFTPQSDAFNFNITYLKSSLTSVGYLNFLEVNARRKLTMSGSAMQFQLPDFTGQPSYNQYLLSNANENVQIWDITDIRNISKMPTMMVNGKMSFLDSANELKSYLAIDPTASSTFQKPEIIGAVTNQNLHGIAQADMVIIANPAFLSQAQKLAQIHRNKDNLTVEVVTPDQVYNEFSSGTPDATAYRWLMKMLYDKALQSNNKADLPKYLLLFGKGSYDNRKIRSDSGSNLILTYQADNSLNITSSYVTDDYFAFLDDNSGNNDNLDLMRIGVGRFTVTTSQQATDVVNKTIDYMDNRGKGFWKNQLCFVADDGNVSLHSTQADSIGVSLAKKYPSFQVNKIYLDAYTQELSTSGQSYPLAKNRLLNLLRSGLFLLNYTGHASSTGWANESILTFNDIKLLANQHLPLVVAATCDFVQFDDQILSAGEELLFNPTGGGIGILAAARAVYAGPNYNLDKLFCETLFKKQNGEHLRIGDILVYTKNNIVDQLNNKLSYVFVGDPALKLNYPTKYQVITNKINESTTFGNDTLKALTVATIHGVIADQNGQKAVDFNGNLHGMVYDKVQRIVTLNNEDDGAMTYYDRPNTLFSGDARVVNGEFSFSFMLPKDIKYNFGGGRINYYASDDTNDIEAQGYFENFVIGGTNSNYPNDTIGPKVDLFLNSENFESGDKVNETPLFMANINDSNGINTVGSGIGHDVMLTIDHDPAQSYILNDYFQANTNSYSSGVVKYKLPILANGKHTLTFRAWDLLNNSTTKSAHFEVVEGLTPEIFSVYNFPNPVGTQTSIVVKHDRPETILNTSVEIFDISGRKIWSFSQSGAENISWNLMSDNAQRVKTGVYFYRVSIRTRNSDITSKTNKMLVVE